jgi:tRNA(Ile2) C34 agmatinyltransferase TiaS
MRVAGLAKLKDGARMRPLGKRKIARVAGVLVDQLVMCPSCGEPMHLSELTTFTCEHCIREFTAEQALTLWEVPGA